MTGVVVIRSRPALWLFRLADWLNSRSKGKPIGIRAHPLMTTNDAPHLDFRYDEATGKWCDASR